MSIVLARIARLAKFLYALTYWKIHVVVIAFGALLLSIGSSMPLGSWRQYLAFCVGFGITALGFDWDKQRTSEVVFLKDENEGMKALTSRRVFLVVAEFAEPYQVNFIQAILDLLHGFKLNTTIFVPSPGKLNVDLVSIKQDSHLDEIIAAKQGFAGGIVLSMYPERRVASIERFAGKLGKPLVIHDNLEHPILPQTSFVSVLSRRGGELAAQAAFDVAEVCALSIKRILVIAGRQQIDRQQSFKAAVEKCFPDSCEVRPDGNFDEFAAYNITKATVEDGLRTGTPVQIIFCTSDSMTLGCIKALREITSWGAEESFPWVIGHDGIPETLEMLRQEDYFLSRVVAVNPNLLAGKMVEELHARLSNFDQANGRQETLEPELQPSIFLNHRLSRR